MCAAPPATMRPVSKPAGLGREALVNWSFAVNDGTVQPCGRRGATGPPRRHRCRAAPRRPSLGAHRCRRHPPRSPPDDPPAQRQQPRSAPAACSGWPPIAAASDVDRDGHGDGDDDDDDARVGIELDADLDWARAADQWALRRVPHRDQRAARLRRNAAPLPAPGAELAAVPRRGRTRRVPRRRHGSRQDGDDAGPPRHPARPAPRRVPAQRGAQLAGRSGPVHAQADVGHPSRVGPVARSRHADPARRPRPGDHHVRLAHPRRRDARRRSSGPPSSSTRRRPSRTPATRGVQGRAGDAGRNNASPSPARRSRTGSPSCGRSSTPSIRGCSAPRTPSEPATPGRSSATRIPWRRRSCARSPNRCCCAARRPTSASSPTSPTRSSRSPTPASPANRLRCTRASSTSCSSTPPRSPASSAAASCSPRSPA